MIDLKDVVFFSKAGTFEEQDNFRYHSAVPINKNNERTDGKTIRSK